MLHTVNKGGKNEFNNYSSALHAPFRHAQPAYSQLARYTQGRQSRPYQLMRGIPAEADRVGNPHKALVKQLKEAQTLYFASLFADFTKQLAFQ